MSWRTVWNAIVLNDIGCKFCEVTLNEQHFCFTCLHVEDGDQTFQVQRVAACWAVLSCPCPLSLFSPVAKRHTQVEAFRQEKTVKPSVHSSSQQDPLFCCLSQTERPRWGQKVKAGIKCQQTPSVTGDSKCHVHVDAQTVSHMSGNLVQQWPETVSHSLCCPDLHLLHN